MVDYVMLISLSVKHNFLVVYCGFLTIKPWYKKYDIPLTFHDPSKRQKEGIKNEYRCKGMVLKYLNGTPKLETILCLRGPNQYNY